MPSEICRSGEKQVYFATEDCESCKKVLKPKLRPRTDDKLKKNKVVFGKLSFMYA